MTLNGGKGWPVFGTMREFRFCWGEADPVEHSGSGGLRGGDRDSSNPAPNKPLVTGVVVPGELTTLERRRKASDAERNRRLVVPDVLVDPERAEHTIATLC